MMFWSKTLNTQIPVEEKQHRKAFLSYFASLVSSLPTNPPMKRYQRNATTNKTESAQEHCDGKVSFICASPLKKATSCPKGLWTGYIYVISWSGGHGTRQNIHNRTGKPSPTPTWIRNPPPSSPRRRRWTSANGKSRRKMRRTKIKTHISRRGRR